MMYVRHSPSAILAFARGVTSESATVIPLSGSESWTYLILQWASIDYVRDVLVNAIDDAGPVLDVDVGIVILDGCW